jgi:L-rhamnose-H+ transport protein
MVLVGVAMIVAGVAILGNAGRSREKRLGQRSRSGSVFFGIVLCVASGLLGSMLNFSFAFGSGIAEQAVKPGAKSSSGAHAIWAIAFLGGWISNAGYAIAKLTRKNTWAHFGGDSFRSIQLSSGMGVLFTAGFVLYGQGATLLGVLGPVVGWPVFQATTIMVSSIAGAVCGEWRGGGKQFVYLNLIGLMILVSAIVVLSLGNRS